jgi:AcrR family transcriptional regulator
MNERSFIIAFEQDAGAMGMATREERREQIAEARRAQILEAALSVFTEKGYSEATVPDVAREAGVAVGTIYNYYESKRDILLAVVAKYVIDERFVGLLQRWLDADSDEFVVSVMENRLEFGFENIDRFWFVMTEAMRDDEWRLLFAEGNLRSILEFPKRFLESRIASGEFRSLTPQLAARAMVGMVVGFLFLYKMEGESNPAKGMSPRKVAEELADLILNGFRTRLTGERRP